MQLIQSNHFRFYYEHSDNDIIKLIVSAMDGAYKNAVDAFELQGSAERFDVYVCTSVEIFKKYADKKDAEYQEWMVGNANYANKRLCVMSPRVVFDRTFDDMLKVCRHEAIHIAFAALGNPDDANIFISEGIAVAFANQIDEDLIDTVDCPLASRLCDETYFYENNGYLYSGVYVLWLVKKYGINVCKRIYTEQDDWEQYLYDGFERDAIQAILRDR